MVGIAACTYDLRRAEEGGRAGSLAVLAAGRYDLKRAEPLERLRGRGARFLFGGGRSLHLGPRARADDEGPRAGAKGDGGAVLQLGRHAARVDL